MGGKAPRGVRKQVWSSWSKEEGVTIDFEKKPTGLLFSLLEKLFTFPLGGGSDPDQTLRKKYRVSKRVWLGHPVRRAEARLSLSSFPRSSSSSFPPIATSGKHRLIAKTLLSFFFHSLSWVENEGSRKQVCAGNSPDFPAHIVGPS